MTDRELLELAAKAAGIVSMGGAGQRDGLYVQPGTFWNALTDDGDALRLAVKLGLTVCNEHESAGAVYCTRAETEEFPTVRSGNIGDPPGITEADYASTRRAIVRAAAEIGKTRSD